MKSRSGEKVPAQGGSESTGPGGQAEFVKRILAVPFGERLREERNARKLSLRDLKKLSSVPDSLISAIEQGRRKCGAKVANQLADAFWPKPSGGWDEWPDGLSVRKAFLHHASATLETRGVIDEAASYPSEVLAAVSESLRARGIGDADIATVATNVGHPSSPEPDLLVCLHDGRKYAVEIKIVQIAGDE